ncbi:hypothetical protein RCL1_008570 [Eukaryota sp. TZLM3-RCL]
MHLALTSSGYLIQFPDKQVFYFHSPTQTYYVLCPDITFNLQFDVSGSVLFSNSTPKLYIFNPHTKPYQLQLIRLPFATASACISNNYLILSPLSSTTFCLCAVPLNKLPSNFSDLSSPSLWSLQDGRSFHSLLPLPIPCSHSFGYVLGADNKGRVCLIISGFIAFILRGRRDASLGLILNSKFGYIYSPKIGTLEVFNYENLALNFQNFERNLVQVKAPLNCIQLDSCHFQEDSGRIYSIFDLVSTVIPISDERRSLQKNPLDQIVDILSFITSPSVDFEESFPVLVNLERQYSRHKIFIQIIKKLKQTLALYYSLYSNFNTKISKNGENLGKVKKFTVLYKLIQISKKCNFEVNQKMIDRHLIEISTSKITPSPTPLSFPIFSKFLLNFDPSNQNFELFQSFHVLFLESIPKCLLQDFADSLVLILKNEILIANFLFGLVRSLPINLAIKTDIRHTGVILSELMESMVSSSLCRIKFLDEIFRLLIEVDSFTDIVSFSLIVQFLSKMIDFVDEELISKFRGLEAIFFDCITLILTQSIKFNRSNVANMNLVVPKFVQKFGILQIISKISVNNHGIEFFSKERFSIIFDGLSVSPSFQSFLEISCLTCFDRENLTENFKPNLGFLLFNRFISDKYIPSRDFVTSFQSILTQIIDPIIFSKNLVEIFDEKVFDIFLTFHLFYSFCASSPVLFSFDPKNLVLNFSPNNATSLMTYSELSINQKRWQTSVLICAFLTSPLRKLQNFDQIIQLFQPSCPLFTSSSFTFECLNFATFLLIQVPLHTFLSSFFPSLSLSFSCLTPLLRQNSSQLDMMIVSFLSDLKSSSRDINQSFNLIVDECRYRAVLLLRNFGINNSTSMLVKINVPRRSANLLFENLEIENFTGKIAPDSLHFLINFLKSILIGKNSELLNALIVVLNYILSYS